MSEADESAFDFCEGINGGPKGCTCRLTGRRPCGMILAMQNVGETIDSEMKRIERNRRLNEMRRPV